MPVVLSHPGVYIEELRSGVRTIAGVSTSTAAFVDFFPRGPVNVPILVQSFADFEREFGGLHRRSEASYGVLQFFMNGGREAWIVRVRKAGATNASLVRAREGGGGDAITVVTRRRIRGVDRDNPGAWGGTLRVRFEDDGDRFHFSVGTLVGEHFAELETFRGLNLTAGDPRNAVDIVRAQSRLVQLEVRGGQSGLPDPMPRTGPEWPQGVALTPGADGLPAEPTRAVELNELQGEESALTGVHALRTIDTFNLLCLPAAARLLAADRSTVYEQAAAICLLKRAFLLIDPPPTPDDPEEIPNSNGRNAAAYFPNLLVPDPLTPGAAREIGPSGTAAGIYAATDATRGVWKAPAGTDARLVNVLALARELTDAQNGTRNQAGINCLRTFPVYGHVVWGARTREGSDAAGSEWKYVPVRRLALFIESSLLRGTQWVVFEPNDEPLWAQVRLNVGAFMTTLFRQGAFAGASPRDAYFVKCDAENNPPEDVNRGVLTVDIGFAPLKPAEFVILRIRQIAGQAAA